MTIDDKLILKLQDLAKLNLTDAERISIKKDLEKIFTMFEKLQEVDTKNVEPFIHFNEVDELRQDTDAKHVSNEEALLNAPVKHEPYFIVPKIIE